MCGIVGYVGRKQAGPILMEGLRKLEYRGYDSAGLAVRDGDGDIDVVRAKGRLSVLSEKTLDGSSMKGCCGYYRELPGTAGEASAERLSFLFPDRHRGAGESGGLLLQKV